MVHIRCRGAVDVPHGRVVRVQRVVHTPRGATSRKGRPLSELRWRQLFFTFPRVRAAAVQSRRIGSSIVLRSGERSLGWRDLSRGTSVRELG